MASPSSRCIIAVLAVLICSAAALRNGLDLVPPMGWSNWENSGCNVNESYVRASADALVSKGLAAAGYTIVEVDDCWANLDRNATGHLVANITRFPSGMGALGKYVHDKGLKFGMYSSAGVHCCQHTMPGSLGYEWIDAQTFASWGVDFLKYDGCFMEEFATVEQDAPRRFPFTAPPIMRYPIMSQALNRTGRNISFMCNFPWQFWGLGGDAAMGGRWVSEVCNSWRVAGDPQPGFANGLSYVDELLEFVDIVPSGPGAWATLDAIEIGNNGSFDVLGAATGEEEWDGLTPLSAFSGGGGGMTAAQEQAVFSLYAVVKTPLFIGADVTKLGGHSLEALTNPEAIAVHQDKLGPPGRRLPAVANATANTEVWAVSLSGPGSRAAAVLLNRGGVPAPSIAVTWAQLGLDASQDGGCDVRDVWGHRDLGHFQSGFTAEQVAASSCVMIVVTC